MFALWLTPLDDHVAVRSEDHRTANHAQADGRVHHVGRIAVRTFAHHGTPIKRFGTSGRSMVINCS